MTQTNTFGSAKYPPSAPDPVRAVEARWPPSPGEARIPELLRAILIELVKLNAETAKRGSTS